ncbi:TRAP transporter small permease [Nesterenkonia cremea]|uniref:Tripartite ATP-independent periplasmic transporters DctQ component domain-containing protein n=1 Tax=Nesterenkonia cremea TaxID=1882340 RepID=A0A917ETM9_9MICC|nr:TRAP transporter small permease [Nesterenkonia cremea]GGE79093.1 hypothetical protein GCM10011401_28000 [Nesterenkonia cremea]
MSTQSREHRRATSASAAGEASLTGWLDKTMGALCALILAAIAGVLCLQVVMRYVVENPLIWADEAARLLMVWLTFAGATLAYRTKSHIAITILLDTILAARQDSLAARILKVLIEAIVVIAAAALLIGGLVILTRTADHTTPALQLPIAVLFLPAALSGAVVLGTALRGVVVGLSAQRKGGRS